MGTDDAFAMPAGTISVLVAQPGGPRSSAGLGPGGPGGPAALIGDAVAATAASCGGLRLIGALAGAVFARAADAVTCALMVQRGLTAAAVPARVAVHTGRSGHSGPAHRGQVFDRCAALSQVAWAGQVLLSQAPASLVADELPASAGLTGLGWHRLGDLGPAERVWQLRHADLPAEFPPLRSLDAHRHNLPVELTSFVPRDAELAEIDRLTDDARLVTVTGSGGCGKTRLALHAAAGRIGQYPSGAWLAELAALRDPARVPATIAEALQLRRRGPDWGPAELAAAIGTGELLLVLDNCEHLVRSCAEVTDGLLRACPELRILATSREPLGVPGEVTWRVPSLSFPPGPLTVAAEEADRFEAVRLFAERARQARPGFTLTPENAAAVTEICARLNGIPLAIELAAARARVFSPAQIVAGLNNRFRLLAGGSRTAVPRQQTLEASVAWSYELLTGAEQAMLRQLSVFAGGFTLEAADAVTAGPEPAVTLVSQLADKSLIIPAEDGSDDRFRMLETIRDYGANRLAEAGEAEDAKTRHFEYVRRLVDRRRGEDEDAYCARLRGEYDNIRAALSWAAGQDSLEPLLDVTTRLVVFWSASTHLAEAVQWLRTATDRGHDSAPGLRARALGALTQIASLALDLPVAFAAGTEGLALQRQLDDKAGIIMTLTSLGSSATLMGEPEAGRPYLHEAITLAEQAGDQRALAYALAVRGRAAVNWPADRAAGRAALRRSIEVARQCGARHVEGIALGVLGVLAALDGDPGAAIGPLRASLPLLREAGDVFFLSLSLIGQVQSLSLSGDYDGAIMVCRELDSLSSKLGAGQLYFAPCARGFAGFARGDWPETIRSFREQLTFFAPVSMGGQWVGHLAWAELIAGQEDVARQRLDEFIAGADRQRTSLATPLAVRALIARAHAEHALAEDLAQQALAAAPADPFGKVTVVECLAVAAAVKADLGDHDQAVRLAAAITAFADNAEMRLATAIGTLTEPMLRASRRALGADRFHAAWSEGESLTLTDAVGYVTRGRGRRSRPAVGWASLTPTEVTVASAVAAGLSNPQIADRMFISRRTVTTHLTSIFRKLGISSRAELAAAATRQQAGRSGSANPSPPDSDADSLSPG